MTVNINLQVMCAASHVPSEREFINWIESALRNQEETELSIRLVDRDESQKLNSQFRGKNKPTNVLSFEHKPLTEEDQNYLGDIVICTPLIAEEANEAGISPQSHWAHITVHGVLHLLGFDHIRDEDAAEMMSLETQILQQFGIADPYGDDNESEP